MTDEDAGRAKIVGDVFKSVAAALDPLEPEGRLRVIGAAALFYGHYDQARLAIDAAEKIAGAAPKVVTP